MLAEGGLPAAEVEEESASVLAEGEVLDPVGGEEEELLEVVPDVKAVQCSTGLIRRHLGKFSRRERQTETETTTKRAGAGTTLDVIYCICY